MRRYPVFGVLNHFAFNVDGADWADFGAFTAGGAAAGFAPFLVLIHDDLCVFAAEFEVKCVGAFDLVADADASCAEYASVAVNY